MGFWSKNDEEVLHELRAIHMTLIHIGGKMAIDFSALQGVDQKILDKVSAISTDLPVEANKIQDSIDALAAASAGSTDPATQAAIDAEVAKLQTVSDNLDTIGTAIDALPTTPTTPAP